MKKTHQANKVFYKNSKSNYDFFDRISLFSYYLFLFLYCFVLTVYMHDGYFDLMSAKSDCFSLISRIMLPIALFIVLYKLTKRIKIIYGYLDIFIILLGISYLISTFFSYAPVYAFSGQQGWYVGSFSVIVLILIYFALKNIKISDYYIYYPLVFLAIFEFMCTVIDSFGHQGKIDILNLRADLHGSVFYNFWGTIGNSNWYIGYLSLLVPLFICLYLDHKQTFEKVLFFIASYLGLLASVFNGTDSVFLAYGLCSFFLVRFVLMDIIRFRRFSYLLSVFSASLLFIRCSALCKDRLDSYNGLIRYIFDLRFLIIFLFLSVVMAVWSRKTRTEMFYMINHKIIAGTEILLGITIAVTVFYFISLVRNGYTDERLSLWTLSLKTFADRYSLKMKIFGIGPELLINVYAPMNQGGGIVYNSSHSELIQVLMTTGLFGLFVWSLCWFSVFALYLRKRKTQNPALAGVFCSLAAYFGQSLINSATLLNVTILTFVMIFMNQSIASE